MREEQLSLAVRSLAANDNDDEEELAIVERLASILTMKIAEYCADGEQLDQIIAMPLQNTL